MIRIEHDGPVTVVLLDRPDRRNALTPGMLDELIALPKAVPSSARALVLAGEGRVFCSGFDLDLCQARPDGAAMRELLTGLYRAILALRTLPLPVVGAVQGAAIAGGCALLGGADFVISHSQAKFGYPVLALGVSPAVSAPFLRNSICDGGARERFLDTALVSGGEAARLGLVTECLASSEHVRPRAMELARGLAAKPPESMGITRAWLRELEDSALVLPPERALSASLALAGGLEERERLSGVRPGT